MQLGPSTRRPRARRLAGLREAGAGDHQQLRALGLAALQRGHRLVGAEAVNDAIDRTRNRAEARVARQAGDLAPAGVHRVDRSLEAVPQQ
jgi:Mg/Co/Ni transporter MgtE